MRPQRYLNVTRTLHTDHKRCLREPVYAAEKYLKYLPNEREDCYYRLRRKGQATGNSAEGGNELALPVQPPLMTFLISDIPNPAHDPTNITCKDNTLKVW